MDPRHGTWSYQLELPPTLDGKRRNPLRRGGFTQKAAEDDLGKAQELLAISNDRRIKSKITDFVLDTVKKTGELPDADTVRTKVRTGQQIDRKILLGDWLDIWLEGKKKITATTKARYASDIRLYLKPHLGHIPVEELRVADISAMFDDIEDYNELIRQARASNDPTLRAKVKWRRVVNPPTLRNIRATLRHALNIAMKQERLIDFNPAAVVELPPATRPKPVVWTDERVRAWQSAHHQHLATVRERAGGKRVNVIEAYIGTPPLTGHGVDARANPPVPATRHPAPALPLVPPHRPARPAPRRGMRHPHHQRRPQSRDDRGVLADHSARLEPSPRQTQKRRATASSTSTKKPSRSCGHTGPDRTANASPPDSGNQSSSSTTKTVTRSTPRTSPTSSNGWPTKQAFHPPARPTPRSSIPHARRRGRHQNRPAHPRPRHQRLHPRHLHQRLPRNLPRRRRTHRRTHRTGHDRSTVATNDD
ncbi:N-terminal phage integrase SAM-like domain-containing protein [Actinoallomurus rhizosphaericola]|nr:N-terminal phage integrase SAM-like domain-containing protein [Actinoallomurus rhizosphaericola]MCO5998457.1 N-terminal phage integrase SAM-like domain-containing protein [Actinoallomurus rhizosphaericola]